MNDHTNPQNWKIKETKIGESQQKVQQGKPVQNTGPVMYNPAFSKNVENKKD